jgi:hypothetical protein
MDPRNTVPNNIKRGLTAVTEEIETGSTLPDL